MNDIRPKSRFFSLAPVGIGTGQVESLDGYLCRLAEAHRVSVTALRRRLGADDVAEQSCDRGTWPETIDKEGPSATFFATRLARLTLQPDVARLGLWNLARHVSPLGLVATKISWCPACVREMLERRLFYVPQAWRLHCYTACPRHAAPMVSSCPHCHRSTSRLDRWFKGQGLCPVCRRSLLQDDPMRAPPASTELIVGRELEALCSALSGDFGDPFEPLPEKTAAWALRESVKAGTVASREVIARYSGIGSTILKRMELEPGPNANLQSLVRICVGSGLSVEGALRRCLEGYGRPLLEHPLQQECITREARRTIDRNDLRRAVVKLLRSGQVPTLDELRVRLRIDRARLVDLLPPRLRERLAFRHLKRRRAGYDARYRELVAKIVAARTVLSSMGKTSDIEQVAEYLGRRTSHTQNFINAHAAAVLVS